MWKQVDNLNFLQAGIKELEDYLLSDDLYWVLQSSEHTPLPRLTIGGLLLAQTCLSAWSSDSRSLMVVRRVSNRMHALRAKWRSAWERKINHERRARFTLWRNYMEDYRQYPDKYYDAYPQEVRWRTMLQLILAETLSSSPEQDALVPLDMLLQTFFIAGEFVWESELASAFPSDVFWFLYGRLKES